MESNRQFPPYQGGVLPFDYAGMIPVGWPGPRRFRVMSGSGAASMPLSSSRPKNWSDRRGLNPRPERWQRPILPLNYGRASPQNRTATGRRTVLGVITVQGSWGAHCWARLAFRHRPSLAWYASQSVPRAGKYPATASSPAILERTARIELASSAWKADAQPLGHARLSQIGRQMHRRRLVFHCIVNVIRIDPVKDLAQPRPPPVCPELPTAPGRYRFVRPPTY